MLRTIIYPALYVLLALALLACDGAPAAETNSSAPTTAPAPTDPPAVAADTAALPTDGSHPEGTRSLTDGSGASPTDTPIPAAVDTPVPVATPEPLFYNLPPATLTNPTILYASPNRAEPVVPVPVPAGETVFVMGRNATRTHLRVVWNTGVGWVPVSFTSYNGQRDRMDALPIFEREPPACAVPITTQFGLNSTWTSDAKQRIAVIADLFRAQYGEFPQSYLALVVNGTAVESSRRQIVEQGQFSLKDVVFSIPQDLQPGDTIGYLLDTSSDEPLTFMATIFSIPGNCKWKLD